jgi:crotonobetainyl-CoA:carnitine CoA-transferase CaiB-like acyl-CoA transferase
MQGVRILEVADYVFVPAAGAILSDWGAEVIKVEHHVQGDLMRGLRTYHPNPHDIPDAFNPIMETANRGKRSIGLNLTDPAGLAILLELVKRSDVFLTSKLESTRQKLGFDVHDLRPHNPRLIYARGTGHGHRGDEAGSGGFDALDFWYRSGIGMGTRPVEVEHVPGMPAGAFGDLTGAMNIAGGISAALFHRERTGEALTVDVSLLGSGMWSLGGGITQSARYRAPSGQLPAGYVINPLVNNYRTSDGRWIALCCLQAIRYWPDLCRVIERPDLADDQRFATALGLDENGNALAKILESVFAERTWGEWVRRLQAFEGQWAPIQDALSVCDDPQAAANGYLVQSRSSTGEDLVVIQPPVQFDGVPAATRPAPAFAGDGDTILAELGFDTERIIELKFNNVVT